jgi:hypothetical protein
VILLSSTLFSLTVTYTRTACCAVLNRAVSLPKLVYDPVHSTRCVARTKVHTLDLVCKTLAFRIERFLRSCCTTDSHSINYLDKQLTSTILTLTPCKLQGVSVSLPPSTTTCGNPPVHDLALGALGEPLPRDLQEVFLGPSLFPKKYTARRLYIAQ